MGRKIPVAQSQSPLAANPFAALELGGLPPGPPEIPPPSEKSAPGRVVLRREKARRGGKTVIVVADFAPHWSAADLADLAKRARQAVGCGGAVAGREIELQGDDPARVRRFLEGEGFRVAGV